MMDTIKHIFQQPEYVPGIGDIYPIQMKNYDDFMNCANIICLSYEHFNIKEIEKHLGEEAKLFNLIILAASQSPKDELGFLNLRKIFNLILKKNVQFDENRISFVTDDGLSINEDNYDKIRDVIMRQNLLFAPKVYKTQKLQEIADKVLQARAKNSLDSDIESMIATIAVVLGLNLFELENYSIYQIRYLFNIAMKYEDYKSSIQLRAAGAEVSPSHFAEKIDMFKSPYEDIFKAKSEFKNINAAVQSD